MGGKVNARSSGTDVLVILVSLATKMPETSSIVMDYDSSNNKRIFNVTDVSRELEKTREGLS